MGLNKTNIEWAKNPDGTQGYTWNPLSGCLNHTPEGLCLGGLFPCYAYKLANGRLRERYLANDNIAIIDAVTPENCDAALKDPFYPRFWEERLAELQRGIDDPDYESYIRRKPRGIFICDMGELFGSWLPDEWIAKVLETIADDSNSMHRFYLLTKQPQNLPRWSPFPDNCWVGVTVTRLTTDPKTDMFDKAMNCLSSIEAKVKFISFEPLLEWDFEAGCHGLHDLLADVIDWLIIGAQTKPYKPPKIEWVEAIVRAADQAGIPVFLKENLRPIIPVRQKPFWYIDHFESHLRQEMPPSEGKGK